MHSKSLLDRVRQQLYNLEKRDRELWTIVSLTGVLVSFGIFAIVLHAAFLKNETVRFELSVSRSLAVGIVVLIVRLNTYLAGKRLEVRRLREEVKSNAPRKQVVEQQSFTDPLTEVYNRRSLDEIVSRFISHARRHKVPLTFLVIDVDKFKSVNSRYGPLTGDFVLAEVANLLKSSIRGCDAIVRYGGDEILILLADITSESARSMITRITSHLAEWNAHKHVPGLMTSMSIGAAEWRDGQTLDEVLDIADNRMYQNNAIALPTLYL